MTEGSTARGARLEALLDEAFDLDAAARANFLDALEPALRADLAKLLDADAAPSPVDHDCIGLVEAAVRLSGLADACGAIAPGQRIGAYRLLRLIGEGGTSSVWLAEREDGDFSHQVAVKCLKTGLATPESRTRFLREQQIMAQMQHPYIARLYDAGVTADNVPYIVMEWVDGVPLTRWCDQQRMGVAGRLQLFLKVCAAVAHAHQNLVVHRDLKPANILVGHDGDPRLLDFGIAKLLDEAGPVTRTGMHMLTPEYAAPEQFTGGAITTATDGYMLGAILYELLCGLRARQFSASRGPGDAIVTMPSEAFRRASKAAGAPEGGFDPERLAAERDLAPERLSKLLRGDLDTIVLKALQAEPERRYATVQAFRDDIERYLRHQPIAARKDAFAYRAARFVQRHAVGVAASVLVVAALVAATGVSLYQARRAQTETRRAVATRAFLVDLFEVSDSGLPRDQVPSTQALLQDGARRVRGEFGDEPEVKFDLLLLLGRVQLHLGQYASAEPLLAEALAIADARFKPDNPLWLQAHTEWAEVLHEQSRMRQAASQLDAAIARYRRAGARDDDSLAEALTVLGNLYSALERHDRAIANAREALDMAVRLHGPRHAEVQVAQGSLGKVLMRAGRYDEAEVVARANVVLSGDLFGEHHARYADSLSVLADALSAQNKDAESEQLARRALAIEESVYDRPNARIINTLSSLSDSLYNQDKLDETEAVLRRWLAAQVQLTSADDPTTSTILLNLGLVAKRRHEYPQAEDVLRRALAIYAKRPNAVPASQTSDTWRALGQVLGAQRRWPEADQALQQALSIDRDGPSPDPQRVGMDLLEFARVDMALDHPQSALERVDEAMGLLGKSLPPDEQDVDEATIQRAAALGRLARHAEAQQALLPLVAKLRKVGSENVDRERLARALGELGRAQSGGGDAAAALASWNEALALQQAIRPADAERIADLQGLIAKAHGVRSASK